MICGRCGRRLGVAYTGNPQSRPVYRCDKPNLMMGLPRCMTFGGPRVDAAIARELLLAVEPMAIEAAFEAERMHREQQEDQHRILDLELQQARYEARLAERRYAACDPDNRLIAAQLEKTGSKHFGVSKSSRRTNWVNSPVLSRSLPMLLQTWQATCQQHGTPPALPCALASSCCGH